MLYAIWNGLLLGLLLAILIGPVFFALIDTSINRGFKAAFFVALGIAVSDILYILITNLGIAQLTDNAAFKIGLAIVGGGVLAVYGTSLLLKKVEGPPKVKEYKYGDNFKVFMRGLSLNFLNPFVLVFWVSAVSFVRINYEFDGTERAAYFMASVATVFITDLLKGYSAIKLRRFITMGFLMWMNRVSGLVLLGFGIRMLYFAYAGE